MYTKETDHINQASPGVEYWKNWLVKDWKVAFIWQRFDSEVVDVKFGFILDREKPFDKVHKTTLGVFIWPVLLKITKLSLED